MLATSLNRSATSSKISVFLWHGLAKVLHSECLGLCKTRSLEKAGRELKFAFSYASNIDIEQMCCSQRRSNDEWFIIPYTANASQSYQPWHSLILELQAIHNLLEGIDSTYQLTCIVQLGSLVPLTSIRGWIMGCCEGWRPQDLRRQKVNIHYLYSSPSTRRPRSYFLFIGGADLTRIPAEQRHANDLQLVKYMDVATKFVFELANTMMVRM